MAMHEKALEVMEEMQQALEDEILAIRNFNGELQKENNTIRNHIVSVLNAIREKKKLAGMIRKETN